MIERELARTRIRTSLVIRLALVALVVQSCSSARVPHSLPLDSPNKLARQASDVATSYLRDVYNGDFDHARRFVNPASRGIFDAAVDGVSKPQAVLKRLSVGDVRYTDDAHASVTLLIRVCPKLRDEAARCVVNTNAKSRDPRFSLRLTRTRKRWFVDLGNPRPESAAASLGPSGSVAVSHP
jgi:hypothetical protein